MDKDAVDDASRRGGQDLDQVPDPCVVSEHARGADAELAAAHEDGDGVASSCVEALLEVRRAFRSIEAPLAEVEAGAKDPMHFQVPVELQPAALELSSRLEKIAEQLAQERPETKKSPTKMIGSLFEAAAIFKQLAAGEMMDESYDAGQIHKRLGNAMADAIIWARVERR